MNAVRNLMLGALVWCVLAVAVMGCADQEKVEPMDLKAALEERLHAYNAARVDWDPQLLYEMHWAAYKEEFSFADYLRGRGDPHVHEYRLGEVEMNEDGTATVEVFTDFSAMGFNFENRREVQNWVLEDNEWRYQVDPVIMTPFGPLQRKK